MVVTAFRDVGYTFDTTPWPTHVTLDNFQDGVLDRAAATTSRRALVNSLIIGVVTTVDRLIVGVFAAYALARLKFPGKYVVLGFVLGASMFPGVALVTPLFQLFTNIGWIGTYQALIIPDISFALPLTDLHADGVLRRDAVGARGGGPRSTAARPGRRSAR